ncbi:MAG: methyltransferase domain-containing protein [Candidatus Cohnella colombiensis]|uniref:Methyltransferase domain-containing protein n=1 Tax=Candidatus Cohnella colombiensis TaxID=3121368 RepID=A0AA95JCK9_9BACL|nr:MAG: methyltransferase domain-containing protein [Cohnella sp.]
MNFVEQPFYIYTFSCHEDEIDLSRLEMRALFQTDTTTGILGSSISVNPSRSPFMRERLEVLFHADQLPMLYEQLSKLELTNHTFKVIYIKTNDQTPSEKLTYAQQREVERELGAKIVGKANMKDPDQIFGIVTMRGRWYFGHYLKNEPIWLTHQTRPVPYSIALPTRIARAIANIAVPNPDEVCAIDPCCGSGTVLIEALSMGINIVGRDYNPLIATGARQNIAHFGYCCEIVYGDIADITDHFDVAILDLPYNHVTKATPEDQHALVQHARRIATRVVVISIASIDHMLEASGLTIIDRCIVNKGKFSRHIMVCH